MIIFEASEKSYRKKKEENYELLKSLRYVTCSLGLHFGYTEWTLPKTAHMKACRWLDVVRKTADK